MNQNNLNHIGSDEAGKGDYFGPLIVSAVYISSREKEKFKNLKIIDSKQLTTKEIFKIAPILIKNLIYVTAILDNNKYNYYHSKNFNLNTICALMHNEVIIKLKKKINNNYDAIIIDQFTKENKYFECLKGCPEIVEDVLLLPKAENTHLAVAAASIISRYYYLVFLKNLQKKYNLKIPSGSSKKANIIGRKFYYKYGKDELKKITKFHFKNTFNIIP